MARNLRDYFEETRARIDGGPDHYAERRARMAAMIVDGCPVGDYETDVQRDYERWKRFEELQWLALALMSCDADLEFTEFRSLAPRHGVRHRITKPFGSTEPSCVSKSFG